MRRALAPLVIALLAVATTMAVGTASHASSRGDRAAAAILDSVPLPPDAKPVDLEDRVRTYAIPADAATVLQYLRDQLAAAGWQEKAISRVPANNNGVGSSGARSGNDQDTTNAGPETSGEGTVGDEAGVGPGDTSSRKITGPVKATWTMAGARLRVKITTAAAADQQTQAEDEDESTFVLRARPGK